MTNDHIKRLLTDATEDAEQLCFWFSIEMGAQFVPKLEEAGIALEDIPDWLEDYAKWMRVNLEIFRGDEEGR